MEWRWIRSGALGPADNMALDEALLRAPEIRPTLRTYRWDPWTISLGYFQHVDRDAVMTLSGNERGIVRRPTGGRAIYHGPELTYSVVVPAGLPGFPTDSVDAYELLHGVLVRVLASVGVDCRIRGDERLLSDTGDPEEFWCFYESSPFDLVAGGRKLVGSAQRRTARGFLQHGSIPTAPNPMTPDAADTGIPFTTLEPAFAAELERSVGARLVPADPSGEETSLSRELTGRRYSHDGWTWRRVRSRRSSR